ncbi:MULTISPECIES: hypothetical protein [Legionella]|uniref:Uncharacterized protein n=1 Tax=Legionella resiliens TaxID=2905958 RepID=A0ABS8X1B7_9GAMM|nr:MULTISPECIES: hypothetical protein [unclassified Legionella]MCE0722041.1 hypothetical protein [Legionella sp. 9fVS26]MCE3531195.1 hypothetical protein [Legionella sp. 8cVS16]QLZ70783.1 hypothetical protein FOLKNPGA_03602 [Legionella sp. PC1000]
MQIKTSRSFLRFSLIFFTLFIPTVIYAEDNYNSHFINESNKGAEKYTLVKTRMWPESGCIIESGPDILLPGEKTQLVIAKKQGCDQAGIGYSLYKTADNKQEHLLGYVSHRFRDGTFSLQVSIFCNDKQCVFRDLNPDQDRN